MSGEITITPGKQFTLSPAEKPTLQKLNELGQPVGRVNEGAIGARELDPEGVRSVAGVKGKNLFCNGDFDLWDYTGFDPQTGLVAGAFDQTGHEYGSANRWLTANDTNRVASKQIFDPGQTDVPDVPTFYLRWAQAVAVDTDINPIYFGQRIEDVRRLAEKTVTFSIWVRPSLQINVTPQGRQYFGALPPPAPSSEPVITEGDEVTLPGSVWTKVVQTFELPSVTGKTFESAQLTWLSWTEFRLILPRAIWTIDFARAQLEVGSAATNYDVRAPWEDLQFAHRYYAVRGIVLSDDITVAKPFIHFEDTLPIFTPVLTPASGTGGTIDRGGEPPTCYVQTADHSAIEFATATADAELYDNWSP